MRNRASPINSERNVIPTVIYPVFPQETSSFRVYFLHHHNPIFISITFIITLPIKIKGIKYNNHKGIYITSPQIFRTMSATVSTWCVNGNISKGVTFSTL